MLVRAESIVPTPLKNKLFSIQFIHKLWGQNGVKLQPQKRVLPHFGPKKQEKTPEINDFRCFFGCGGGT